MFWKINGNNVIPADGDENDANIHSLNRTHLHIYRHLLIVHTTEMCI